MFKLELNFQIVTVYIKQEIFSTNVPVAKNYERKYTLSLTSNKMYE